MKSFVIAAALAALVSSLPIRREVPQEHSHNKFLATVRASLATNNPNNIADPVFGLLGDAAAKAGLGKLTDPDCLQLSTADQAFTNAKAANDVAGMVAALQYRALERNTGSVGLASVNCSSVTAVNPEIAAVSQHQDPASPGAAANNKAVVLELARQIASIGGDPTLALQTGTFAPGKIGDPTAAGNTCDTADDVEGCIFTENKLVEDATTEEITAAVAGITSGAGTGAANVANPGGVSTSINPTATNTACSLVTVTMTMTVDAGAPTTTAAPSITTTSTTSAPATTTTTAATTSGNLQTFTGSLGGLPPPVTAGGSKGFLVEGAAFIQEAGALGRSCDEQHNTCANAANAGGQSFTVSDCDTQNTQCHAAITA